MSAYVTNGFYRWDILSMFQIFFMMAVSLYSFDVLYINIEPSKNIAVSPQLTWLMFKPKSKKSASCQERSLSCSAAVQLLVSHSPVSHLSAKSHWSPNMYRCRWAETGPATKLGLAPALIPFMSVGVHVVTHLSSDQMSFSSLNQLESCPSHAIHTAELQCIS